MYEPCHGDGNSENEECRQLITAAFRMYESAVGTRGNTPSVIVALVPDLDFSMAHEQLPGQTTVLAIAENYIGTGESSECGWMHDTTRLEGDPHWIAKGPDVEGLLNTRSITGFDHTSPLGIASSVGGIAIVRGQQGWELLVRWVEETAGVPYRHWRKFETVDSNTGRQNVAFRYVLNDGMRIDVSLDRLLAIHGLPVWKDDTSSSDMYVVPLEAFRGALAAYLQIHPRHFLAEMEETDEARRSPVLRLDHIGVVSKYENQIRKLLPLLGARIAYEGPVAAIGVHCEYHALENVDIEIVSPMREDSIVSAQRTKLPFHPLHHLAFEVESLEAGVEYFRKHGYHPIDGKVMLAPKPYHRVVFLSPMQTKGLLIELVADEGRAFDVYRGSRSHAEGASG